MQYKKNINILNSCKEFLLQFELFRPFLAPGDSLLHHATRQSGWFFAVRFSKRFFMLLQTIILARLIKPEDFGLFGIVMVIYVALEFLTAIGIRPALIQRQDISKDHLDTAWTFLVLQWAVLAVFVFLLSKPISLFFNEPKVVNLIRVFSISVLLTGFTNIGTVYFDKEFRFKNIFLLEGGQTLAGVVFTISLAFMLRNVWALIIGSIVGKIVNLVLSFLLHEYRPSFTINRKILNELFTYGKWLWISTIFNYFILYGDNIFVGKVLGTSALGFYRVAYSIGNFSTTAFANIIRRASFPAFSKLQREHEQLRRSYLKVTRALCFIVLPLNVGLFIFAPEFVKLVLGKVWLSIVPVIRCLTIFSVFNALILKSRALFNAMGTPRYTTYSSLSFFIVAASTIYPFSQLRGLLGVVLALSLSAFISWLFSEFMAIKLLSIKPSLIGIVYSKALVSPLVMGIFFTAMKKTLLDGNPLLSLLILPPIGVAVFLSSEAIIKQKIKV